MKEYPTIEKNTRPGAPQEFQLLRPFPECLKENPR